MTLPKLAGILTNISIIFLFANCKGNARNTKIATEDSIIPLDITVNYTPVEAYEKEQWLSIINSYYDNYLSKKFNGQVLIAKNGEVIFEKYNGKEWYQQDTGKSMNEHSAINLASSSKPLTATAILMLQQQGKLHINDSVAKYLPGFPYPDITIKMLLNHRSGILNYLHNLTNWGWNSTQMITNDALLELLIKNKPILNFPSDTRFLYSNTNYTLLASIVEKVSGKKFPQFMHDHIFGPLQMKDTYVFSAKDTMTAIPSFYLNGRRWHYENLDATYGDKNIYSTVRDLYKFDQALYTSKLLNEENKIVAYQGNSFEKPGMKNYGLGWRMLDFPNQKKIIFHNGWWHGFRNSFIRLIQDSTTIICLGNNNNYADYSVMQLSYLFGDYPFEYEAEEGKDTAKTNELEMLQQLKLRADSLKNAQKIIQQRSKKDSIPLPKKKDTMTLKKDSILSRKSKEITSPKDSL